MPTIPNNTKLYTDPNFTPNNMLGPKKKDYTIQFARPHQICENPKFYVDGGSRFDVIQGSLGDCWFLSALSTVSMNKNLLYRISPNQSFDPEQGYDGKFKFYFYKFGKFIKVEIDDLLPVKQKRRDRSSVDLIYATSDQKNEFWVPLMEKAYAKLNHCYENLEGGNATEAMVDLTGGFLELYEFNKMKNTDQEMADLIYGSLKQGALLTTAIQRRENQRIEEERKDGLIIGHAYAVTGLRPACSIFPEVMVKIRNPWGDYHEYNGPGSDLDKRWQQIKNKNEINQSDGEFHVPFSHYMSVFTKIEVCRLNYFNDIVSEGRWIEKTMRGEWKRGVSAGGSWINEDKHFTNPQMQIEIGGDKRSDEVIIFLSQSEQRKLRHRGGQNLHIGFSIYSTSGSRRKFIDATTFSTRRDTVARFRLRKGKYVIIPCCYDTKQFGEFFLRVLVEQDANQNAYNSHLADKNYNDSIRNRLSDRKRDGKMNNETLGLSNLKISESQNPKIYLATDQEIESYFNIADTNHSGSVNYHELSEILINDRQGNKYAPETVNLLFRHFDIKNKGKLKLSQFKKLWQYLEKIRGIFVSFDQDNSNSLEYAEIKNAVAKFGLDINHGMVPFIMRKFDLSNSKSLQFDEFVRLVFILERTRGIFEGEEGGKSMDFEEFVVFALSAI